MNNEIPIFFTTDDNYVPYLDVAVSSLIANASREYSYRIIILNTGIAGESIARIKQNERPGFVIDFVDISKQLESIMSRFKNVYHFSVVTYYRLFIASLFPEYDKIIYLDCDLVVTGDISELYSTPIGNNILAAVPDQYVRITREFREYAKRAVGVDPDTYFNAGVLIINLDEFRQNDIEGKFIRLISEYDFDLLDPDQAYLNYLCYGKTHLLPNGWNKSPTGSPCEGDKNIVHYNLYKKPWHHDDVIDGEYFWQYAELSPFYDLILERKASFKEKETAGGGTAAVDMLTHAIEIAQSDYTFVTKLGTKIKQRN